MIKRKTRSPRVALRSSEAGVTLVELMIACLVMVIGLVAMAQLFIVATMSQTLAVNQSHGAEDCQRFVDALRVEVLNDGLGVQDPSTGTITFNADIFSATYQTSGITSCTGLTSGNPAFLYHMYCYDPTWFTPKVWIYDFDGNLVNPYGTMDPAEPPGVASADLTSPSKGCVKVFVRLDPRDESGYGRRSNVPVTLTAIVSGDVD